jgi:hypothetical protein
MATISSLDNATARSQHVGAVHSYKTIASKGNKLIDGMAGTCICSYSGKKSAGNPCVHFVSDHAVFG